MTNNTSFIKSGATESRYVVYRGNRATPPEVLGYTATVAGAKRSVTLRNRKGEFDGYDEYGFYCQEKYNGIWMSV